MVRANIKSADEVYLGLIDELNNGFRILWNWNMDNHPEYDRSGSEGLFSSFEAACEEVYRVVPDADICETIFYRSDKAV